MKNISNAFKRALFYNKRDYIAYADITLVDGTVLHLTNDEIWQGGYSREEAISQDENFTLLGSAIINPATLIINNIKDKFSEYIFEKATVQLSEAMEFTDETPTRIETLYAGVYTVEDTKYNGATIKLSLVDNMSKFDRPYSESSLSYPATCDSIIRNACSVCGVTLQTFESALKNLSIPNPPEKEGITFREVISWVATICGCYAKCDTRGRLELKWIDRSLLQQTLDSIDGGEFDAGTPYYTTGVSLNGGTFNPWNTGDVYDGGDFAELDNIATIKGLSSQDICVDDTVIAGVRILIKDKTANSNQDILSYIYPANYTEGFVVEVSDNEFITTDNVQTILTHLGTLLYGMTFRKLSVTQLSDPSIEAGDIGLVIDRKQHTFAIIVTRCTFKIGASQTIVCGSESALNNSSTRFSQATKTFLETKAMMNVERNERVIALQQLSNALNSKAGLYTTVQATSSGNIYYMHDLPNLSESKIVWKMTNEAWGVTTNYNGAHPEQTVWNAGMTVDGNTIVNILSAVGISASWINTGEFSAHDSNGNETFYVNADNGTVRIVANSFSLSNGSTIDSIAQAKASAAVNAQTQQSIFNKLTNNSANQGIYLENGKIYINSSYIKTGELVVGGPNNTYGKITVKGVSGTVAKIDLSGITAVGHENYDVNIPLNILFTEYGLSRYHDDITVPDIGLGFSNMPVNNVRYPYAQLWASMLELTARNGLPISLSFSNQGNNSGTEIYRFEVAKATFSAKLTASELHASNGYSGTVYTNNLKFTIKDGIVTAVTST